MFNNVLDLVLINDLEINNDIQINAAVDTADHNVLLWTVECRPKTVSNNKIIYVITKQIMRQCARL